MNAKILKLSDLWADQVQAIDKCLDFALGDSAHKLMLLEGPAGTGKTSSGRVLLEELPEEKRKRSVVCAPTNKAVKVARQLSGGLVRTTTIYKLLRLTPQANGEVKELRQAGSVEDILEEIDLVYLDEGSMVGQKEGPADPRGLRYHIEKAMVEHGVKFIAAGDRYQLPPVGEPISWIFGEAERTGQVAKLTDVKRHDNQILNLATHLRKVMDGEQRLRIADDFDDAGGVEVWSRRRQFEETISDLWRASEGQKDAANRVLAWRNDKVADYNDLIRETVYGRQKAKEALFQVGERIVVCNPVKSLQEGAEDEILMHTDEEGIVVSMDVRRHPIFNEIECYALVVDREDAFGRCGVFTPTPDGRYTANRLLKGLYEKAQKDRIFWGAYWNLKEHLNDVRPCHALTVHRSQGSTFKNVFVDIDDVLVNRNYEEALRCLYVAATRPSAKLNLKYTG